MEEKRTMSKKTLFVLIFSGAVFAADLVLALLFSSRTLTLTDTAVNIIALSLTVALVVFAYTLCKHLGLLKGQKQKKY